MNHQTLNPKRKGRPKPKGRLKPKGGLKLKRLFNNVISGNIARIFQIVTVIFCITSAPLLADVKVAFLADQGIGENAEAVLQLIQDEEADIVLIQGDLGYGREAASTWQETLERILGSSFPVLVTVGNHENYQWSVYKDFLVQRINSVDGLDCAGDPGVKAVCHFENIEIVQVSPGISEVEGVLPDDNYPDYITKQFSDSDAAWRICSWHKNQQLMQIGGKKDETGWEVYQACSDAGALIATGHEHSYSRTHLLSNFENQTIVHTNNHLELDYGQSFAFVSGLGGKTIRDQKIEGDWWASSYSSTQNASHGALFCSFGTTEATCYFKDVNGAQPDMFSLETRVGSAEAPTENETDTNTTLPESSEQNMPQEELNVDQASSGKSRLGSTDFWLLLFLGTVAICRRLRRRL